MHAVACVILNRARHPRWWGGPSIESVCKRKWQFSCRNPNDPNSAKLAHVTADDPAFAVALEIAQQAVAGSLPDITNGADSYVVTTMPNKPAWARNMSLKVAEVGKHTFYRLET